jgi:GINS complex protein
MTAPSLNQAQLEVLKLMVNIPSTEEDIAELKKLLLEYLYNRAMKIVADVDKEKGYTQETFEQWKNEHMRVNVDELRKRKVIEEK